MEAVDDVAMETIRQALLETTLEIGEMGDVNGICANAPSFVELSQGNDTVREVVLYLHRDYHRRYKTLRVLGKGFCNLEALQVLTIQQVYTGFIEEDDEEDVAISLYWQALTGSLGRLRHKIELRLERCDWGEADFTHYAMAIQGLSTIRAFHSCGHTRFESADTLMSALASLPSLENVTLGSFGGYYEEECPPHCAFRELTNLLKAPSLRSIEFTSTNFTSDGSKALLAAFEEESFVTTLRLTDCDLEDSLYSLRIQTIRSLVQALQRNCSAEKLVCKNALPCWE
jgi:hypothetical protein